MAYALLAPRPNSHPFQERQLFLKEPVKIGRAVAKVKAAVTNGIFACKVLSRNHAILWYENGKFMLQDTKSSNGTYVNSVRLSRATEESDPCEIKSGDILQFGIQVVEESKNVTHGCIVGLATLFHEDGTEATGVNEESPGVLALLNADKAVQPNDLWQLSQFLQDALHREQMLENKLATLQRMISNSHVASEDTFQGFIQEDKVLSRLETLENQLELFSKDLTEADAQSQLINYQEERLEYEAAAKETLQRILTEKIEVLQKCSDLERLLSNAEDECTHLKSVYEKSTKELGDLIEQHRQIVDETKQLKDDITASNQRHESIQQQTASEKQELKSMLEDAEKRGSSLAVEVESLQAECDFTKKQLEAVKERLEQQKEDGDRDLPFASDHATLEKDVKNKTTLIRTLKDQLNKLQEQLDEKRKKEDSREASFECAASGTDFKSQIQNIRELKDVLHSTRLNLLDVTKTLEDEEREPLIDNFDAIEIDTVGFEDFVSTQTEAIITCKEFLSNINASLTKISNKAAKDKEKELSQKSNNESIKCQLSEAHNELKEVRKQILCLGEQLLEEQEINKKSKELASTLEHELMEACKRMDMENLDQSLSFNSLENARKLADQMITQSAGYSGKTPTDKRGGASLLDENEEMREQLKILMEKCERLREENLSLKEGAEQVQKVSPPKLKCRVAQKSVTPQSLNSTTDVDDTSEFNLDNLHAQLSQANQSLDDLTAEKDDENEKHTHRQHQLLNIIFTLLLVILISGVLIMLGMVDISPGTLPLLDEHTWNELLEHLF